MKTKTKVILGLSMIATILVSGKELPSGDHQTRTNSINVQPCEWGNSFLTPTVDFKDTDRGSVGSRVFHQMISNPEQYMQQKCLEVARVLYRRSQEAPRFRKLGFNIQKKDGQGNSFVAYLLKGDNELTIVVSSEHLTKIYQDSGNNGQIIKDEIDGILYHEVTHGYNHSPEAGGTYDGSSPFWAYTEGIADAVRIHAGFHQTRTPDPNNGRKWLGGYTTTGFFLHYVSQKYDKNFLYKFNEAAKDLGKSWSFDASFKSILGKGVEQVWNEYKNYINSNNKLDYDGDYPWVLDCSGGGNPTDDVDITNDGGVVTSQHNDSPNGEGINQLIDDNINTKYLTFNNKGWVKYEATKTYKLSSYTITSGNDAPNRDPKSWTLEGSVNGSNWTVIDQRNNQDFPNRRQKRTFTIQNAGTFKSYRLTLTNNSGNILQLSEVELFGKDSDIVVDAPVASFTANQQTITEGNQITFSNTSTGAQQYEWTFTGGNPSTSTAKNPVVRYDREGRYDVQLKVTNSAGSDSAVKRGYITVTRRGTDTCEWGNDFLTPTIIFKDSDGSSTGSQVFHQVIPDAKRHMQQKCLEVAQILYRRSSEAPKFRQLTFEIKDGDFVAYKYGDGDAIGIVVSTRHLTKIYRDSGNDPQVIKDEIDGILYHEVTHGYNNSPEAGGTYDGSSPFWAYTEGIADGVRIYAGYHQTRQPDVNNGKRWLGGYTTTGFFLQYVTQKYDKNFIYKFNKAAKDLGKSWSFDASFKSILGKGVEQVWNEYKNFINSNGKLDYDGDYPWVLDCSDGGGGDPGGEVDITNDGGTVSGEYSDSPSREGIENLIDDQSTTKYLTFHNKAWVQYKAKKSYKLVSYTITSGNDAPSRDPKDWVLQGSNNGRSWVVLDERNNQDFPNRREKRTFIVQDAGVYSYYRLTLTNNSGNILQLSEIELFGKETSLRSNQKNLEEAIEISTYPNPVRDKIYIQRSLQLKNKAVQLEVYDIQGRMILKTVTKGNELDVQRIDSKMYFMMVRYNGSVVYKGRFVKQ